MSRGQIAAVCVSKHKGTPKTDVGSALITEDLGIFGDAHSGDWHRQISLLSVEQIAEMQEKGVDVGPGSFAENITTRGVDLDTLKVGDRVVLGDSVLLEVTQIGKECHTRCAIFHKVGDCIMPERGVFARVLHGGKVVVGDKVILQISG